MHLRILKEEYVIDKIGGVPNRWLASDSTAYYEQHWGVRRYKDVLDVFRERRIALYRALCSAYVENSLLVRVPFFGFSVDVNDLGIVGGLALLIIMGIHRFALSREMDNLRLAFDESRRRGCEEVFYKLLAMHQVFTVPRSPEIHRTLFLRHAPKFVIVLPFLVQATVFGHDWHSFRVGAGLNEPRARVTLFVEVGLLLLLALVAWGNLVRVMRMDRFWHERWNEIHSSDS